MGRYQAHPGFLKWSVLTQSHPQCLSPWSASCCCCARDRSACLTFWPVPLPARPRSNPHPGRNPYGDLGPWWSPPVLHTPSQPLSLSHSSLPSFPPQSPFPSPVFRRCFSEHTGAAVFVGGDSEALPLFLALIQPHASLSRAAGYSLPITPPPLPPPSSCLRLSLPVSNTQKGLLIFTTLYSFPLPYKCISSCPLSSLFTHSCCSYIHTNETQDSS